MFLLCKIVPRGVYATHFCSWLKQDAAASLLQRALHQTTKTEDYSESKKKTRVPLLVFGLKAAMIKNPEKFSDHAVTVIVKLSGTLRLKFY